MNDTTTATVEEAGEAVDPTMAAVIDQAMKLIDGAGDGPPPIIDFPFINLILDEVGKVSLQTNLTHRGQVIEALLAGVRSLSAEQESDIATLKDTIENFQANAAPGGPGIILAGAHDLPQDARAEEVAPRQPLQPMEGYTIRDKRGRRHDAG